MDAAERRPDRSNRKAAVSAEHKEAVAALEKAVAESRLIAASLRGEEQGGVPVLDDATTERLRSLGYTK
jgi:hypothetical protein